MISAVQLIAVLFQVISLVTSNPNIPSDTKSQIISEITQAVGQANSGSISQNTPSAPVVQTPVTKAVLQNGVPVDGSSIATSTPATLGAIVDENGVAIIPVIFNDASEVTIIRTCDDSPNYSFDLTLEASDYPSGYSFHSTLGKSCNWAITSRDSNEHGFGVTKGIYITQ